MSDYASILMDPRVMEIVQKNKDLNEGKNNDFLNFLLNEYPVTDFHLLELSTSDNFKTLKSTEDKDIGLTEANEYDYKYKLVLQHIYKTTTNVIIFTVRDKEDAIYLYDIMSENITLIKE